MRRAERQPFGELTLYAGIYLKTWAVPDRGTLLPQHAHEYDHITYVVAGTVRAWRGAELLGEFVGPAVIKIAAREKHQFLTLSDRVTFLCIHSVGVADDVAIAEEHALVLGD